jgi:hypothetical protein
MLKNAFEGDSVDLFSTFKKLSELEIRVKFFLNVHSPLICLAISTFSLKYASVSNTENKITGVKPHRRQNLSNIGEHINVFIVIVYIYALQHFC